MWWVEEYKFGCLHSEKEKEMLGGGSEPSLPDVAQLNKEVLPSEMKKMTRLST
jgi:hypothetical protein